MIFNDFANGSKRDPTELDETERHIQHLVQLESCKSKTKELLERKSLQQCSRIAPFSFLDQTLYNSVGKAHQTVGQRFFCETFYRPTLTQRKCNTVSPTYPLENNIKALVICGLNTRTLSHPQTTIVNAFNKF